MAVRRVATYAAALLADTSAWVEHDRATGSSVERRRAELIESSVHEQEQHRWGDCARRPRRPAGMEMQLEV